MLKKIESKELTLREKEVLELTGKGLSNKEIARHLGISPNTVKTHLHRVYVKINAGNRIKTFHAHQSQPPGLTASTQLEIMFHERTQS